VNRFNNNFEGKMKPLRITLFVLLFLNPILLLAQISIQSSTPPDWLEVLCTNSAGAVPVGRIAKLTGAPSKCAVATTTDTTGLLGISTNPSGIAGTSEIQLMGAGLCDFDGSTTAGDWVQASATTGGKCHDAGSSQPGSGDTLGRVLSTNAGVGTYDLLISVRHPAPSGPINAWCTGTVGTGNGTTYSLLPGSNAITCGGSAAGAENPIVSACTAQNLQVRASVAGAVAGSGVVALFKNGSASALTCTLGTTLTCSDITHTVALTTSDTWSVRITTGQGSDTTANPRAVFQCL
jgi:hypothetical protein